MLELHAIGNIGSDLEEKTLNDGRLLVKFRLAAQHRTARENVTTWINVSCFGKLAELARSFLHKGSKIYVNGLPSAHGYKNRMEEVVASIDIIANQIEFLDRKGEAPEAIPDSAPAAVSDGDIPF